MSTGALHSREQRLIRVSYQRAYVTGPTTTVAGFDEKRGGRVVDSYDGAFQKLSVEKGGHKVELKAEGYEPLSFDVLITPGETVTYKGEMKRIQ